MIAKNLINQIQATLEGGSLAQRFINEVSKTRKIALHGPRKRFLQKEIGK